ncbi:unnamed protein product [Nezara viridula]|uniref:Uncharacterized protein n=1 Tax=Nezara viridula TaxID=85310 RepID=A0A9P0H9T0_NEZVI|nr:unnamed protein product [Nezara viridula]
MAYITSIFIYLALAPAIFACMQCPEIKRTKSINFAEIAGDWFMVASTPDLNVKCRNIVISKAIKNTYKMKLQHYENFFFTLWHNVQTITVEDNQNYSKFEVPNPFSLFKTEYTFLDGDLSDYMLLHTCYRHIIFVNEYYELWTRNLTGNCQNVIDSVTETLDLYKIKPEDMTCSVPDGCYFGS